MNEKNVGIFWGIVLIVLGAVYLVTGAGWITIEDPKLGLAIFAPLAALFFTSYYLSGPQRWGWLFPACIFTALSVMMLMLIVGGEDPGPVIAVPLMLGIAAPFFIAYIQDRTRWWALIPGYIMLVLAVLMAFVDQMPGEWFATVFMLAVAVPFLVVFLLDRSRKWALIPFAAIAITGLIPLLSTQFEGQNLAGLINLMIGVPFLIVYFWSPRNWWALIPAGFFISVAVGVVISGGKFAGNFAVNEIESMGRLVAAVMFTGWALTFFLLWLRRKSVPTAWAIYPAAALIFFAVVTVIGGSQAVNNTWPVILIAAGGLMVYNNW
ncbi:MAG: hypothetical protein EHM21_10735, partial [Chloroflexi bacterium]